MNCLRYISMFEIGDYPYRFVCWTTSDPKYFRVLGDNLSRRQAGKLGKYIKSLAPFYDGELEIEEVGYREIGCKVDIRVSGRYIQIDARIIPGKSYLLKLSDDLIAISLGEIP